MTYIKASRQGFIDAEATQQASIDITMQIYREASKEIVGLIEKTYAKLTGTDPINYYAEMVKYDRYTKLSAEISSVYKKASTAAGKSTKTGLTTAMTENYNRQQYLMNFAVPVPPTVISSDVVTYAVTGSVDAWKKIQDTIFGKPSLYTPQAGTLSQLLSKNYTAELDKILQTVQNGYITGKSYAQQSKAIKDVIGKYLKGADKATGAMSNALRIARTEGTRVMNAGTMAAIEAANAEGINTQKMWDATLDLRTRSAHQSLDGTVIATDALFHSSTGGSGQAPGQMSSASDNIRCRCSLSPIVDGIKPTARRGRDPLDPTNKSKSVVIDYTTYPEWLKMVK